MPRWLRIIFFALGCIFAVFGLLLAASQTWDGMTFGFVMAAVNFGLSCIRRNNERLFPKRKRVTVPSTRRHFAPVVEPVIPEPAADAAIEQPPEPSEAEWYAADSEPGAAPDPDMPVGGMDITPKPGSIADKLADAIAAMPAATPRKPTSAKKILVADRKAEARAAGFACCPRCGSTSLSGQKHGYGVGKAAAGVLLVGGIGLVAGGIGANKVKVTCLNCGYQFRPGQK